jgi:hypothetical protein
MTQVLLSDHIAEKLQQIAAERGATLLDLVEQIAEDYIARTHYDEAADPAIALISGPIDFAQRAKELLLRDSKPQSGWTQKEAIG